MSANEQRERPAQEAIAPNGGSEGCCATTESPSGCGCGPRRMEPRQAGSSKAVSDHSQDADRQVEES